MKYNQEQIREDFKDFFEHSLDLIYVNDLEGNFLDANHIALKKLGYKKSDIPNLSYRDLVENDELAKAIKTTKEIIHTGKYSERTEYTVKKKNGDIMYLETYAIPIKKDGIVIAILGVGNDITESKLDKLKLEESEKKYRYLFENSPYFVGLLDSNGFLIDCNDNVNQFLAVRKKKDIIGRHYTEIFSYNEKNKSIIPIFEDHIKKTLKCQATEPFEILFCRSVGGNLWAIVRSSLIKFENKTLIQFIIQDVTEQKKAENLIIEEIKKLKDLDQIRKDLISRVSHELKTPIMSIFGSSELLLEIFKDQLGKDALELVEIIDRGVKRLIILIENLLDTSKIEFNKIELNIERVNLSKVIKENTYDMMHFIKEREIDLNLDLPENFPILLDKIRIGQVITNLLSNAIKNSPPKGKIRIDLHKIDNYACINISDTGVGLTQSELNRIFTRFGKIERYGKGLEYVDIQGSGLGLYISNEIVELHGGEISATSKGRNKGSMFTVKLPIK